MALHPAPARTRLASRPALAGKRRRGAAAWLLAALVAAPALASVPWSAADATTGAAASGADDAGAEGLSPEARDAFVERWAAQLREPGFLEAFLRSGASAADEVPGLAPAERLALARGIVDRLAAERGAPPRQAGLDALLLHRVLFDRAGLERALAGLAGAAPHLTSQAEAAQRPGEPVPGAPAATGHAPAAHADEVRARIAGLRDAARAAAPPLAPADPLEGLRPTLDAAPPRLRGGAGPAPGEAAPALAPAPAPPVPPALLRGADPPLPPLAASPEGADPLALPSALAYQGCGQELGGPVVCSPTPVPFGTPVLLDLDQDALPDVQLLLLPVPLPEALAGGVPGLPPDPGATLAGALVGLDDVLGTAGAPGLGVTLQVRSLVDAAGAGPLPCDAVVEPPQPPSLAHVEATCSVRLPSGENNIVGPALATAQHVASPAERAARAWVVYGFADLMGEADSVVRIGVDGTADKLPGLTTMKFKVDDLAELVGGRLLGKLNVTFEEPGAEVTLFAEVSEREGDQAVDPTLVSVRMAPVPDLGLALDAMLDGSRFLGVLDASLRPLTAVTYEDAKTGPGASTTRAVVVLDTLPSWTLVEYEDLPDGARLRYEASDTIGLVTAAYEREDAASAVAGSLEVHGLPDDIEVTLHTDGKDKGSIHYAAGATIPLATGTFAAEDKAKGVTTTGSFSVADVPATFDITYDETVEPSFLRYEASSELGPVALDYATLPEGLAFHALVESLPPYVQVRWMENYTEFDGRSSADAEPGSGAVGALELAYATDGVFLGAQPPEFHVSMLKFHDAAGEEVTRMDVRFEGLSYVEADQRDEEVHMDFRTHAPHPFARYRLDTPSSLAEGFIDGVPGRVTVDAAGTVTEYRAYGDVIDEFFLHHNNKSSPPLDLDITVLGVPDELTLDLDFEGKRVGYAASAPVPGVTVVGDVPANDSVFEVTLKLLDIPTAWTTDFADGDILFASTGGPLGHIALAATNFGMLPAQGGCGFEQGHKHLCAHLDLVTGDTAIVLELGGLSAASFLLGEVGGDTTVDVAVEAADPTLFVLSLDVLADATSETVLFGTMNPLPGHVTLRTWPTLLYTGDQPFDLAMQGAFGNPARLDVLAEPPVLLHGIAVHANGLGVPEDAVKTRAVVTGIGTKVEVNPDPADASFAMEGWQPKLPDLGFRVVVDADPADPASEPTDVEVAIRDLHPGLLRGSFARDEASGATTVSMATSQPLDPPDPANAVDATLKLGALTVTLGIRNVPEELHHFTFRDDEATGTGVDYAASGNVARVDLGVEDPGDAPDEALLAAFGLQDIPADFTLAIRLNPAGPEVLYDASGTPEAMGPDGLDLVADVVLGPPVLPDLDVRVEASDIGRAFHMLTVADPPAEVTKPDPDDPECGTNTAEADPGTPPIQAFKFTSTPATPHVSVTLSTSHSTRVEGWGARFCIDIEILEFRFRVGFTADTATQMRGLGLHIQDLHTLTLSHGFVSTVRGDYGQFDLDWGQSGGTLNLAFGGVVKVCLADTDYCISPIPYPSEQTYSLDTLTFYGLKNSAGEFFVPVEIDSPCLPVPPFVPPWTTITGFSEMTFAMTMPFQMEPHLAGTWQDSLHADGGDWTFVGSPLVAGFPIIPPILAALIGWFGAEERGISFGLPSLPVPIDFDDCVPFL